MKLECSDCGYSFERNESIKNCPYCGSKGTVSKATTAQDFLDSSDD